MTDPTIIHGPGGCRICDALRAGVSIEQVLAADIRALAKDIEDAAADVEDRP